MYSKWFTTQTMAMNHICLYNLYLTYNALPNDKPEQQNKAK